MFVKKIDVVEKGSGFTAPPPVTITGDGTGATATSSLDNGKVNKVHVTSPGSGYTTASATVGGDGTGCVLEVTLDE